MGDAEAQEQIVQQAAAQIPPAAHTAAAVGTTPAIWPNKWANFEALGAKTLR